MYKASIGTKEKEILLELLKLMSEADGNVTHDEMDMIYKLRKMYQIDEYEYKNYTKNDIRRHLEGMEEKDVLNLLTHAILLALEDGTFSPSEQNLVRSFFDLVSLENAVKMQKLIDEFAKSKFDIKVLLTNPSIKEINNDSMVMLNEFSTKNSDSIDERLLMKMNKGPIKKVWGQVINLWTTVNDPKNNKAVKAIAIGALLYLIFPMDVIPDLVPMLGLTDDVTMVTLALSKLTMHYGIKFKK
ncbi:MAG: DUF1232 domain-containing protein [Acholeplasmataceae bacterium]|nr:DUF1232 domain-containing protein [Acholeplasmataceae bacterium]